MPLGLSTAVRKHSDNQWQLACNSGIEWEKKHQKKFKGMLEWRSLVACNTNSQPSLPCRGRKGEMQAASGRVDQKNKKWQSEKQRGWVRKRERERDSVCDSTKMALRFHHSFKRYCWISECLFTLSAYERERQRQKEKHEEEMWERAGNN